MKNRLYAALPAMTLFVQCSHLRNSLILTTALAAAWPLVAQTPGTAAAKPNTYAQKLIDQGLAKHPEIVIFVLHVKNADGSEYPIVASNVGRYGKKADEDDLRVIHTGKPNLEVNSTGNHFEVEMQLHDSSNNILGAVSVVYNYKKGEDQETLHKKAEKVRAEIEEQIPSLEKLLGPK